MDSLADLPGVMGKFALAITLAGALGLERERKGRAAGLRTHILVCLGATLAMVISEMISRRIGAEGGSVMLDQARIAAGVITGVGFLGAGTIIHVGSTHRGLTTAAMIWFVASLGLAIGAGLYVVSIAAAFCALVIVVVLERLAKLLPSAERFTVTMHMPHGLEQLLEVEEAIREQGYDVVASRLRVSSEEERADMTFELVSHAHRPRIEDLAQFLRKRFASAQQITFER